MKKTVERPTNSDNQPLGPIRCWILTYLHSVQLLRAYGERAWPWNVRFVWGYVQRELGLTKVIHYQSD